MHRRAFIRFAGLGLGALASFGRSEARVARPPARIWNDVFSRMPPALAAVASDPAHAVQLIWMRRERAGAERWSVHDFGLRPRRWFPAASVAKLPMALLMAEAVQAAGGGIDSVLRLDAPPATGEWGDESLAEPFVRGIDRTFAVSDNRPYNRWYELLGGDRIHRRLAEMGDPQVRLIARLGSSDPEANRRTGGGALFAADGRVLHRFAPAVAAARRFPFGEARLGTGWRDGDGRIAPGPRDFSRANFLPLADSLRMLQAFVAPESVPAARRWRIDGDLRVRLLRALTLRPRDCDDPVYPEAAFPDSHARWFFVGDGSARYPEALTVSGKSGMAYGALSEVARVADRASGAEFLLAASVYANADGILNDDRYEYDGIARPFLAAWSRAVLECEREYTRRRGGRTE